MKTIKQTLNYREQTEGFWKRGGGVWGGLVGDGLNG